MDLIVGNTYARRDIHKAYGGTAQGGISPTKDSKKIFIFSNDTGSSHGYEDGWSEDGVLYFYTGAGQVGDQDLDSNRHNGRLLRHQENGDEILLFTGIKGPGGLWQYVCNLTLVDYEYFQTHDSNGDNRTAIRFVLERTQASPYESVNQEEQGTRKYRRVQTKPSQTERRGLVTSRVGQGYYRHLIKQRFEGKCAVTGLEREDLLIASHIVPWRDSTEDEKLDVNNGILLAPNYDAVFDKHLISFTDDGHILVSPKLTDEARGALGITGTETIKIFPGMLAYLARHRKDLQR